MKRWPLCTSTSLASPACDSVAAAHRDPGLVLIRPHVKAILARRVHRVGKIGRVNLDDLSLIQAPHRQVQRALVQLDLQRVVIQIRERERWSRLPAAAPPRRSTTPPASRRSVQIRSAVVRGRFRLAATQSSTPPGWMETCPSSNCRCATRPGGSADGPWATANPLMARIASVTKT